jgi:hypothetical protein
VREHYLETGNKISNAFRWVAAELVENTSRYDLLLFIGETNCSFCFYDDVQRAIVGLCDLMVEAEEKDSPHVILKAAIETEPILTSRFRNYKVAVQSRKNTLVPNELFEPKSLHEYFDWVTELEEKEILFYDPVKNLEANNIYSVHKKLYKKLNDIFPNPEIFSLNSVLLHNLLRENKGTRNKKMFAYKEHTLLHLFYIENGKLIFSNSFTIETEEDFVYYILAVCEQLHINTGLLQLVLMGNIEPKDSFHELLTNYLEHIGFADFPKGIYIPQELQQIPAHRFHHLIALALCE